MAESFSNRVTSGGRVTIPKDIRDELDLDEGDRVKIKIQKDGW
jgi:AbrB family looped-hinge helix DNA binding protein